MKKLKKGDMAIIAAVVVLTALFAVMPFLRHSDAQKAVITYGGNEYSYSLGDDKSFDIISNGITLSVVIENRSVRVTQSDCPDKTCVGMGSISKTGEFIACAPAGVYIKITGGEAQHHDVIIG